LDRDIATLIAGARSTRTRTSYVRILASFIAWSASRGLGALPAEDATILAYLHELAGRAHVATVLWHAAGLSAIHRDAGFPSFYQRPGVRRYLAGLRRARKHDPSHAAPPLVLEELRRVVTALAGADLRNVRDRAVLLLGFCGALRRSELAGVQVEHLALSPAGVVLTIPTSKTSQARAQRIAIPTSSAPDLCARGAVGLWLDRAGIRDGAVFRRLAYRGGVLAGVERAGLGGRGLDGILRRGLELAGLDAPRYSMHSLRAGLVTSLHEAGASLEEIMRITRHRSRAMVVRYIREHADPFQAHPLSRLL
jgi:integrase